MTYFSLIILKVYNVSLTAIVVESMVRVLGKYHLGEVIGSGNYGIVYLATHVPTQERCAIKMINKEKLTRENLLGQLNREIAIMKILKHDHVVKLRDLMASPNHFYIVMELVNGGELLGKLRNAKNGLDEEDARRYFQQLIQGLDYCHHQGIAHRDLKPQNLLLDDNDNIKIADFGLANIQEVNGGAVLKTTCGSPQYVAPEVVNVEEGRRYNGHQADVWSCGVILFQMLSGRLPFDDRNKNVLFEKIRSGVFRFPSTMPDDAQDLISKMLTVDPNERITIEGIMQHPFFTQSYSGPSSAASSGVELIKVSSEDVNGAVLDLAGASTTTQNVANNEEQSSTPTPPPSTTSTNAPPPTAHSSNNK